jgi:very-short-patch-repair endonuclease
VKTETVVCSQCSTDVIKPAYEVARSIRLGRRFFCNLSCAASFNNKATEVPVILKQCGYCKEPFTTKPNSHETTFCSNNCRRKVSAASALKAREAWKYIELKKLLIGVAHEFEYPISGYVFDLVLFDIKLLIEFDGFYHKEPKQKVLDAAKDAIAVKNGFSVYRVCTDDACVIPSEVLSFLS